MPDPTIPPGNGNADLAELPPPCLLAGLRYEAMGYSVVPLCHPLHKGWYPAWHYKACRNPGKQPVCPWKRLMRERLTPEQLVAYWKRNPHLNVGILLGSISGVVGIDVDGTEGEEALARLSAGDLPATLEFRTGGGGRRLLYACPRGTVMRTVSIATTGKPLTILGEGSLTVMPPSLHKSGRSYEWRG